jgi:hypothetical protein
MDSFDSSGRLVQSGSITMLLIVLLLGLGVGVLVGPMGVGGGVVLYRL